MKFANRTYRFSFALLPVGYLLLNLCCCLVEAQSSALCDQVRDLREEILPVKFQSQGLLPSQPFLVSAGKEQCDERL